MLNIIVSRHRLLIQITSGKVHLPDKQSLDKIADALIPIHTTENRFVATTDDAVFIETRELYFVGLRQALSHFDFDLIREIVYYQQLHEYYSTARYCGKCGKPVIRRDINKFVYCENCQSEIYPYIAPCVIVRIHYENKILMARGVNFPPGAYGLIAGFVEIGESLEEGLMRETQEEVGIEIENIRYWGSQSWPFPSNSLMIGFTADYKSGELKPDGSEIEHAGFYAANELPGHPSAEFSIAYRMIEDFCRNQKS